MAHRVHVAVLAADLPPFEPPLGDSGFDMPYAERTSAKLEVDGATSLDDIYRQAIAALRPQAVLGGPGYVDDPYEVVRWVWFSEPADDGGIPQTKVYEVAEDIIVVEADGTARWNLTAEQITVDHLLRSADRGLLRGDPLRPYLVLLLPQGGEAFQTAWEVALAAWQIVINLLAAHDLYTLLRGARREEIQTELKDGTDVVDRYRARWSTAGGGPSELVRTLERRPWSVADLRALLGVATDDDAQKLLRLFGFEPNADGDYVLSERQELRLLHTIGQEASLGGFDVTDDPERAKRRLATTLETGPFTRQPPWKQE
jgi:hypothetical protein